MEADVLGHVVNILKGAAPLVAYVGAITAVISLAITLKDRQPKLLFVRRKGEWSGILGRSFALLTLEVYNPSSRPNTVCGYDIRIVDSSGEETAYDSEQFTLQSPTGGDATVVNPTPLTVPPYSGAVLPIGTLVEADAARGDLSLRVVVTDIFGMTYPVEQTISQRL